MYLLKLLLILNEIKKLYVKIV